MFSPRTHRRQNSAETSYQKGKSPYYPSFPLFPFFLSTAVTGGGAAIFSLQHALTTRNGLDKVVQFVFASAAHAKGNDLPSTMNRSRNTYSRISRMNDFIPNFRNMLLLPTFCDESRFWIIVSGSERSRNSWLGRQLEARLDVVSRCYTNDGIYLARIFLRIRVDYAHLWKERGCICVADREE